MKDGDFVSKKFYDTNALLNLLDKAFMENFVCSTKTLEEIENIKVSAKKDSDIKHRAKKLAHLFDNNVGNYEVVIHNSELLDILRQCDLEVTPDNIIIASAIFYNINVEPIVFVSDDICCKVIARSVGLTVESIENNIREEYTGFKEVNMSEGEMAYFYEHLDENICDLLVNQYLIIKDLKDNVVDVYRWDGKQYTNVKFSSIKSSYLGSIKPYNGDTYQQLALNSLSFNQVTMLKGVAGSGKSYLALGYLFYLLDKRKIDKIVIFCNTVCTINSARLGFYPGSKDEKLLDSAMGNMLSSKLGGIFAVEQLIQENKLVLLPMSDIRGYDTTGMNAGIYITEAQNMDISLMKLALQRIGEDCICVIDGDYKAQVDMPQYGGNNNGMKRMSEVFRGQGFYGEVELQNIYRSEIAKIAENM